MFLLICFVLGKDYCIETTSGRCQNICKNRPGKFEKTFSYIPKDKELDAYNNDEVHNFYIADDVSYLDSIHNFIFCDPSIHLIYDKPLSSIRVKEHIYVDSDNILIDAPILFKINNSLIVEVDTEDKKESMKVILESVKYNSLITKFYVEQFPENLISISPQSNLMAVDEKTDFILKVYNDTEKFVLEHDIHYYCLSDKQNKCAGYNIQSMHYINSLSDIVDYSVYLIIDTTKPQKINCYQFVKYYHIVALKGSYLTYLHDYYTPYPKTDDFYVILHSNSIEMQHAFFEGDGNVTLQINYVNISLLSTTKKCNVNFSIETGNIFSLDDSYIKPIKDDFSINMDKRIHVRDFSLFRGPAVLDGMFEPEKFLRYNDEFINDNLTSDLLKEYDYVDMQYYFKPGTHEIPVTWKKTSRLHGVIPNQTTFIYNDVHFFDGYKIDDFIDCNMYDGIERNSFIIRPSYYFIFDFYWISPSISFNNINLTIEIKNDIHMFWTFNHDKIYIDEFRRDQTKIIGNGNIYIHDPRLFEVIQTLCQIEGNINLIEADKDYHPLVYLCIGQESLEKCKSEIPDIHSLQDYDWIWLRNLASKNHISGFVNIEKTYLTDKHEMINQNLINFVNYDCILTAKGEIEIYKYEPHITIRKNQIDTIVAAEKTAKLTYVFSREYNVFYNIIFDYIEEPLEIDFNCYFTALNNYLAMRINKNYTPYLIDLYGECTLFVRDYMYSNLDMFKISNTIKVEIDNDFGSQQILYSDELQDNVNLTNFIWINNYEELIQLLKQRTSSEVYIYKNIQLEFIDKAYYPYKTFHFYNNIIIDSDLPDETQIFIKENQISFIFPEYRFSIDFNNGNSENRFRFNVKDNIFIHIDDKNADVTKFPKIEFIGSKHSVEVYPNSLLKPFANKYKIKVHENLTIISPYPDYISGIFDSIEYSSRWCYLYNNDELKSLFQSNPFESIKFNENENDENLKRNIVLAVGNNDIFRIPPKWTNYHNIFIIQDSDCELLIDKPLYFSFLKSGIELSNKIKFINGNFGITVTNNFTFNIEDIQIGRLLLYSPGFQYHGRLISTNNDHINIYIEFSDYNYFPKINLDWTDVKPSITFYGRTYHEYASMEFNINSIKSFKYDHYVYISYYCYSTTNFDKCPKYSLFISSKSDFYYELDQAHSKNAFFVSDFTFDQNINIKGIDIYTADENIKVTIPSIDELSISSNYFTLKKDEGIYYINDNSHIFTELEDYLHINVYSDSITPSLTFSLKSNIIISGYRASQMTQSNFKISLINNSYKLYSEKPELFQDFFDEPVELMVKKCAYDDESSSSFCLFNDRDSIDNIFNGPINYQELQMVLLFESKEIKLPINNNRIDIKILEQSSKTLTINDVTNVNLSSNYVKVNEFWNFSNYRRYLILKLEQYSTISINRNTIQPITFQLTQYESFINLTNSTEINIPLITIQKYGNKRNKITVFGSIEHFNTFINSIFNHDGIDIIYNGTEKYYCVCNNDKSCEKCQSNVKGDIVLTENILVDPGFNANIRIFSNIEISSKIFTNEHYVFIDDTATLNLTDVSTVNQNIYDGIQIDKLIFKNANRIILKPTQTELNIIMKIDEPGPDFYVEVNKYLKLNVTNINDKNVKASKLYVSGSGELYSNNYPIDKIINIYNVKIYQGVYIICNSSQCITNDKYEFIIIAIFNSFLNIFNSNTKIIVFLYSFINSIDVNLNILNGQKIEFDRNQYSANYLLEDKNKLRFTTTTELINKADSTTELSSQKGGALLDNSDSDLFIVGFDSNLTIKQEGNITSNIKQITIQPMNEDVTIFIDDSVDLEKQKIKIEPNENLEKEIKVKVVSNKNIADEELKKFIENGDNNIKVIFENSPSKPDTKKNGLPIGAIIGIVVGVIVIVAVIILIVLLVLKKKNKNIEKFSFEDSASQLEDSTF